MSYPYAFALAAELNRRRVYDKVVVAIEKATLETGMTQSDICERIGRKPPQLSAWLSGPSNWTLDTISDLLRSIGASMDYTVVFDAERASLPAETSGSSGRFEGLVEALNETLRAYEASLASLAHPDSDLDPSRPAEQIQSIIADAREKIRRAAILVTSSGETRKRSRASPATGGKQLETSVRRRP